MHSNLNWSLNDRSRKSHIHTVEVCFVFLERRLVLHTKYFSHLSFTHIGPHITTNMMVIFCIEKPMLQIKCTIYEHLPNPVSRRTIK